MPVVSRLCQCQGNCGGCPCPNDMTEEDLRCDECRGGGCLCHLAMAILRVST